MTAEQWTMLATRVLAPNPGLMTLEGTNSYVIRDPSSRRVVIVDPGPRDSVHLERWMRTGEVDLVLLTHRHLDHAELAPRIHELTAAPVRAFESACCIAAEPLVDGEVIVGGGTEIEVLATPGHTADSVCFHLPHDRRPDASAPGSLLTGDTILGRGSTILASPDGSLRSYLTSLERLRGLGAPTALPGHGPRIDDLIAAVDAYREHRLSRLRAVADAVTELGEERSDHMLTVSAVTDRVYADVAPAARFAAEANVSAQLHYLAECAIEGVDPPAADV